MTGPPTTLTSQQLASTVQLGGRTVGRDILDGIHAASRKTGMDFTYMLAKADRESSLRADAANARGSARGLFQFTRETWLDIIHRSGGRHGLGQFAALIDHDAAGNPHVNPPEAEARILALRDDPLVSAIMAAEYAGQNKTHLAANLDRPVRTDDIYLAHFLGPTGAVRFLGALETTPYRLAEEVFPAAAKSNPELFNANGRPRTLDEVHAYLKANITDAMRRFDGAQRLTDGPAPTPPGLKPPGPPPEDMGRGVPLVGGPPLPPGTRPAATDGEDLGTLRMAEAAAPILPPGPRPAFARDRSLAPPVDLRTAETTPPARPDTATVAATTPPPTPAPAPAPDRDDGIVAAMLSRLGRAPASSPTRDGEAESVIADILGGKTRSTQHASPERSTDPDPAPADLALPGPSAVAMAALLDMARENANTSTTASTPETLLALARHASTAFKTAMVREDDPSPGPVALETTDRTRISLSAADGAVQASLFSASLPVSASHSGQRVRLTMPSPVRPPSPGVDSAGPDQAPAFRRTDESVLSDTGATDVIADILGGSRPERTSGQPPPRGRRET